MVSEHHRIKYLQQDKELYRGHSNSSFKKLTEMEKKQLKFLSMIERMNRKAIVIDKLRHITNAIASNCAYHEKNMEEQEKKFERLNVPEDEKIVLKNAWDLKGNLGKSLKKDLEELIKYVETNNNQ